MKLNLNCAGLDKYFRTYTTSEIPMSHVEQMLLRFQNKNDVRFVGSLYLYSHVAGLQNNQTTQTVPDLPLCLGVHKHRAPLARGAHLLPKNVFYDGFLLMWCNFKFEGVLFRSDSRHNNRVDSLWECATKQAVMTVAQWHRNQIIRGPLVIGKKKCLRWIHAYVVQF